MADKNSKVEETVDGKYYVDDQCISCNLCVDTAPDNFSMGDANVFVAKQPENDDEAANCEEALGTCPVNAIGNDGP